MLTPGELLEFIKEACPSDPDDRNAQDNFFTFPSTHAYTNQVWGTPADPKITCINTNQAGSPRVKLHNIDGAGILIVNSNLEIGDVDDVSVEGLRWDGLVIAYAGQAEIDIIGTNTRIKGMIVIASTGQSATPTEIDFDKLASSTATREILYCSSSLVAAQDLFVARGGLRTNRVEVKVWLSD